MVMHVTVYVTRETTASVDVYDSLANVLALLWLLTIPLALFFIWWRVRVSWKVRLLYTALATAILTPITSYTLVYAAMAMMGGV